MIESICLSPHGDELLGDDGKFSLLRAVLRRCGSDASAASSFLVVSPHGVRVSGHVSISRSERVCSRERCYAVDRELARSLHEHGTRLGAPSVLIGFGTDSGEQSVLPLDWGSEIPLSFFPSARSVVVAVPPRDVPWERLVAFGEAAASAIWSRPEPVGIMVSADQAHAHSPRGPYGYSPRAKEFDAAVIRIVRSGALESLLEMDRGLVEDAKPDSPWQLLVLAGILRHARSEVVEMAYQVAVYYGMLAARYSRPVRRRARRKSK